ncbi:hydrogenase expression/formation protein HypE [Orenia marismortui]|uniref:hydrogenase expression/formation protein HypE n=1 Tax=Orenia marismortui TaxID=46469 RepID=UPI0003805D2E|nr:hydrogenase expression/formation protein HypE [Orenia marismortui]
MKIITMAHGSGGKLTEELIEGIFYKSFKNDLLLQANDSTLLSFIKGRLVATTDNFVVKPIFFRGGDIGKLSICGTVNDLLMSGSRPLYITVGFIIEEGFEINKLEKIVESMAVTALKAKVKIVSGDTKVVERGSCDGVYINTTGIGVLERNIKLGGARAEVGDKIIINGSIGDHGASIFTQRGELEMNSSLQSDCTLLNDLIVEILDNSNKVKVLRDPTRGGLATTLNEIAGQSKVSIKLKEEKLLIRDEVRSLCQIAGFDPLYLANEGKVVVVVDNSESNRVLEVMRKNDLGREARVIGEVVEDDNNRVYLETSINGTRIVNALVGELLPRIC